MLRFIKHVIIAAAVLTCGVANAAWPDRPVTMVVPFAAGGISDVIARMTAERLQAALGQPFVIQNEGGAGGSIAMTRVARAQPDGYTLFFSPVAQIAIAPFMHKVDFDPAKDFRPIAIVAMTPFVITARESFPASTLDELIAHVKSKPGQLTYGSAGVGSLTHLASAIFLKRAGLEMIHVPYKGVAPAFADLLAGHIELMAASPVELMPHRASGKLKLIASTGAQRSGQLPDLPALGERYPGYSAVTWNTLLAPAATAQDIVEALSRTVTAAQQSADFRERLVKLGVEPVTMTPDEFTKVIAVDIERWRDAIRTLGLATQ